MLLKEVGVAIKALVMIGGLTLFIFGIKLMSSSFERVVSVKLKSNINKLTSSKLVGVMIGIFVTGLLQSSSATTLIIISLVHGNLLSLYNAVPIIMGANIGTTFTAQLIAYKPDNFIPYIFFIGLLFMIVFRKNKLSIIGKILIGLSFIFAGIEVISYSINSAGNLRGFKAFISHIDNNNLLGVATGIALTSIIQSSSTGVAMLQVLASSGMISVKTAIPIILGQNIGTCVDTLVGSMATNRIGKQAAFIHLIFNVTGVVIFYFLVNQLFGIVKLFTPYDPVKQVANTHTIFNVATTMLLLPFSTPLVNLAKRIIRD